MRWVKICGIMFFLGCFQFSAAQESPLPEKAFYLELGGKGFFSFNYDFPLTPKDRITVGITFLDHEFAKEPNHTTYPTYTLPTPSAMYFRLEGNNGHFFETGLGISISPVFWREYSPNDSFLSLHGDIGYRYQKNDFLFRAGFTPFYRVNWAFLPLVGISFGYSWE